MPGPTLPTLNAIENAEGVIAAKTYLKANMPGWELAMVPEAKIEGLVAAVVNAVDAVRASDVGGVAQPRTGG